MRVSLGLVSVPSREVPTTRRASLGREQTGLAVTLAGSRRESPVSAVTRVTTVAPVSPMTISLSCGKSREGQRPIAIRSGVATSADDAKGRLARGATRGFPVGALVAPICPNHIGAYVVDRYVGKHGSRRATRREMTESGNGRGRSKVKPRSAVVASPSKVGRPRHDMAVRSSRMAISTGVRPSQRIVCRISTVAIGVGIGLRLVC